MNRRHCVAAILAVVLLAVPAGAEEEETNGESEERLRDLSETVMDDEEEELADNPRMRSRIQPLGKMLRLGFKLVPEEGDNGPQAVTVATRAYAMTVRMGSRDGSFAFDVRGELMLVGEAKEELGITFQTHLEFRKEGNSGYVAASGSAIVPIGRSATLANMGKKSLVVTVTEVARR